MINWEKLVGEAGTIELAHPFLVLDTNGNTLIPVMGKDGGPGLTQFLMCVIKAFDAETKSLVVTYRGTNGDVELHMSADVVVFFGRASAIIRPMVTVGNG